MTQKGAFNNHQLTCWVNWKGNVVWHMAHENYAPSWKAGQYHGGRQALACRCYGIAGSCFIIYIQTICVTPRKESNYEYGMSSIEEVLGDLTQYNQCLLDTQSRECVFQNGHRLGC